MTSDMTKNVISSIYNDTKYLKLNSNWHQEDSPYKFRFVKKIIEKNNIKFSTCADIGCGAGLITELLAMEYPKANLFGFDLASDAQKFWEGRTKLQNLKYDNTDIFNSEEIYDLIICLDVFEHVENYYNFLIKLRSKGKKFIFNIPLDMNVMKVLTNGIKFAREEVGHLHYFNEYTAVKTLDDCGFKVSDKFLSAAFLKTFPRNKRQLLFYHFGFLPCC